MNFRPFIEAMRTETLGFSFEKPWKYSEKTISCVVPILRMTDKERNYLLLSEAGDTVKLVDTGNINKIQFLNEGREPVFIRLGEIIKGETQERTTTFSLMLLPGEKKGLDVKCVHASRGIVSGAGMRSDGGYLPGRDALYSQTNFDAGVIGCVNQQKSWEEDRGFTAMASCSVNLTGVKEDDISAVTEAVKKDLKDVIEKVPLLDNQIGIALIDTKGLYVLECYDLYESWKVVKESIVGKESLVISEEDDSDVFEYKPEKAKELVKKILAGGFEESEIYSNKGARTIGLDYKGYTGEVVTMEGVVIHLLIARK